MFFSKMRKMLDNRLKEIISGRKHSVNAYEEHMLSLWKEIYDLKRALEPIGKWHANKLEEEDNGPRFIKQTIRDTVNRATDIWGLDYEASTDGIFPAGNRIGRRVGIAPQDVGRNSWFLSYSVDKSPCHIIKHVIDEGVFIIIEGYYVDAPYRAGFDGVLPYLAGILIPYIPFGPAWERDGEGYSYRYEQPVVLSPMSEIVIDAYHNSVMHVDYRFALIGQVVAKRSYLVRRLPVEKRSEQDAKADDGAKE